MSHIESHLRSSSPVSFKIQLDSLPFRFEDAETTKKLLIGSLVLLICDETLICATIIEREVENLRNRMIYIAPILPFSEMYTTISIACQLKRFHLFESCVYFEAYKHVLNSIHRMEKLCPALERHFIMADKKVRPPQYLDDICQSDIRLDVSCLYQHKHGIEGKQTQLLSSLDLYRHLHEENGQKLIEKTGRNLMMLEEFLTLPQSSASNLNVNQSQLQAIKSVFNHRICLIQGPPGTGKSYVGKLIVQLLLENRSLRETKRSPILVVCYTNRALDSFLESMMSTTNRIIRIGGRSKSEKLEIYNLQSLKKGKIYF